MDVFYTVVLAIATAILILILTYIGIQISNKNTSTAVFPPVANSCPDFWSLASDNVSCAVPTTGKNKPSSTLNASNVTAGYSATPTAQINFTDPGWTAAGSSATCSKKTWANKNNIMWDGVTNYNKC